MEELVSAEILARARTLMPGLKMGSATCEEWRKRAGSCLGCPEHEHCMFFATGYAVAVEDSMERMLQSFGSKDGG